MAPTQIQILKKVGNRGGTRVVGRHQATFEPVRTIKGSTIGWASVAGDDVCLRFPAIVDQTNDRVVTVRDWQAPSSVWAVDLGNPHQVAWQVQAEQGRFLTEAGNESNAVLPFARGGDPARAFAPPEEAGVSGVTGQAV